uniref:Uncharacterized protein n=1 Tax=Aegilops tauschii subsp. strangulata TaxID=200361 RepID=A0A453PYB8_AEGTS
LRCPGQMMIFHTLRLLFGLENSVGGRIHRVDRHRCSRYLCSARSLQCCNFLIHFFCNNQSLDIAACFSCSVATECLLILGLSSPLPCYQANGLRNKRDDDYLFLHLIIYGGLVPCWFALPCLQSKLTNGGRGNAVICFKIYVD